VPDAAASVKEVATMIGTHTDYEPDQELREINPIRAWALKIWGPANSWDNPLTGTRYDPVVLEHKALERKHDREARREQRRRARHQRHARWDWHWHRAA
jgi:hypothetical protein